jgi:hypothetical protein
MAKKKVGSKDEQIGFHKGSLSVLAKEREELMRMLGIVEQLMQMHIAELQQHGVDLTKEVEQAKQKPVPTKPPIEELI